MDSSRFDRISKRLATHQLSRRAALRAGGGFAAALGGVAQGASLAAQPATPAASPAAAPVAVVSKQETDPRFMFVQSFQHGALVPKVNNQNAFTLTLSDGLGHTVAFSDRPERTVGAAPTKRFLEEFPFGEKNPPNAALVMEVSPDEEEVVVVELTNPTYDETSRTATYDATVLPDDQHLGMTFAESPGTADTVPHQFDAASLFIDDCPNTGLYCTTPDDWIACLTLGVIEVGTCWEWACLCCVPCRDYSSECDAQLPDCNNGCITKTQQEWLNDCEGGGEG